MNRYYFRRQILSDSLCQHLAHGLDQRFDQYSIGGNLLTPELQQITANDPLDNMAQVMSATFAKSDGEERYMPLSFNR
ncbi:MAG: hypothetical protein H0X40_04650 [Chthoniobacterales bacterium]|nr:hypothetical protein [Chthoniobacterales bacterium]